MILPDRRRGAAMLALCGLVAGPLRAEVDVTTYHNDLARLGDNVHETVLTPTNVNWNHFGKLFTVAVDGYVYAQPLYLAGVKIGGGTHNVLYVATEHDSVYALDADSGLVYWRVNLIPPGGRTVVGDRDIGPRCDDIVPEIGITGTPVINSGTNTLYVVAKSFVGGSYFQYLHALDVGSGKEKLGGPVSIAASVPGSGYDAVNGVVSFNAQQENQRPALTLDGDHVYIAWSSHCDVDPWHGWVIAYDATTLKQEAAFNTTPDSSRGGVWMSGGGIAADSEGNIYLASGNGLWDGTSDYGDSIVKLAAPIGNDFPVVDYFTPFNQSGFDAQDLDLGSGGVILLPTLPSGQELLALMGKFGTLYVVDRNDMGKYCRDLTPACVYGDPQIVQEITHFTTGVWGTPAYWNGRLYFGAEYAPMTSYSYNLETGLVSAQATSQTPEYFGYPGPTPSISANGSQGGILWGLDASDNSATCAAGGANCQILYAYDATNLANLLYSSNLAPNGRDVPGAAVKFATPTIANGKVYVGSQYAVSGYGELAQSPVAVSLESVGNVYGLGKHGTAVGSGGLDGHGDAYAASLLGSPVTWSDSTYTLAAPGPDSAVDSATIPLPAGADASLSLLATGVDGAQADQVFLVTYTDGTTASFTRSLSDWYSPQFYPGESIAAATAYRITKSGNTDPGPVYLYGYSFSLNSAKTVKSLTLPKNRHVVVLAVDVTPAAAAPPASR